MSFLDIEYGFQQAFLAAWSAYKRGSIPVGCAIVDTENRLVATGENSIYATDGNEIITNHSLAHAELNAILKVAYAKHGDKLRSYTLYTTMEPCPLCFGAIVQGQIRHVKFAVIDKLGGAAALNKTLDYIKSQHIDIQSSDEVLQILQICLVVYRRLQLGLGDNNDLFGIYREYCPIGVKVGQQLYADEKFNNMVLHNENPVYIYDYILNIIENMSL